MSRLGELAAEFAELVKQKKDATTAEKDCAQKMAAIEAQLLEVMSDEGMQNFRMENGMTLYHAVDKFYGPAEGVDPAEFIQELGRHPQTMDLVEPKYNANSLRARLKEIEANGETLPADLQAKIRIIEKDRVRHRS